MNEANCLSLPRITVAICTYDRPGLLGQTLQTVVTQNYPSALFELLVIDNNSPPQTRAVVESFQHHTPAPKWILETAQGLSHARNRGIQEATGEIIVFADDDILAQPEWLREMVRLFLPTTTGRIGAVGGTVLPIFPDGCPTWCQRYIHPLRYGDHPHLLNEGQEPMGASLAVARRVFGKVGLFRTDLGRRGASLLDGEEAELLGRIRQAGYEIWFAPDAVVHHQMLRSRLTLAYFCRNSFDSARSRVIGKFRNPASSRSHRLFHLLSRFVGNTLTAPVWLLTAALCGLVGQTGAAKQFLVRGCRSLGYVVQILRISRPMV